MVLAPTTAPLLSRTGCQKTASIVAAIPIGRFSHFQSKLARPCNDQNRRGDLRMHVRTAIPPLTFSKSAR